MAESLWITPTELATLLGVTRRTIFYYIEHGQIPQPQRFTARNVRWLRTTLADVLHEGPRAAGWYSVDKLVSVETPKTPAERKKPQTRKK